MLHVARALLFTTAIVAIAATATAAQERRRSTEGPPAERVIIKANPRYPFVGSWDGAMKLGERTTPIGLDFTLVDGAYSGTTIWPNDARAPHSNAKVVGQTLQWEMKNSGGGIWYYQAKISADSLVGSVELRGAVGFEGVPTAGTFALTRRVGKADGK